MTSKEHLLIALTEELNVLERIGENDMGHIPARLAGRYHTIVDKLRALINDISKDRQWWDSWRLGLCGCGSGKRFLECDCDQVQS